MKQRIYIIIIGLVTALLYGCDENLSTDIQQTEKSIILSASKQYVITRAGDQIDTFKGGTRYGILEVNTQDQSTASYGGTEQGKDHTIQIDATPLPTFPIEGSLDFYGVTYGSEDTPPQISQTDKTVSADDSKDLMFSNNLKDQTAANGVLQMNFKHALSKLTFEVVKQVPQEGKINLPNDLTITSVKILDAPTNGVLNLETGTWSLGTDKQDKTVFSGNQSVTTEVSKLGSEIFILPNPNKKQIEIQLSGTGLDENKKSIVYELKQTNSDGTESNEPFVFESNHTYKLTIMILNNDVRIVAILPQVYEWIDIDMNQKEELTQSTDIYLGQPVTFGNLMWMDRNLGARSADCEKDWYHTIGYYYQHGRNIPYILDIDVWKNHYGKTGGNERIYFDDRASEGSENYMKFPYGLVYTLTNTGEKESRVLVLDKGKYQYNNQYYEGIENYTYENIAINPGDKGDYRFIKGINQAFHTWAITSDGAGKYKEAPENDTYWNDVNNHPCPKGWRLPKREDLYSFMPETGAMAWETKYPPDTDTSFDEYYYTGEVNLNDQKFQGNYFAGYFKVDRSAVGEYSAPLPATDGCARVYGIKYPGTDKAYRILIEQRLADRSITDEPQKKYVRVSRFNTNREDQFAMQEDTWNLHLFDWENPAEYMDFPLCGFFDSYGYIDDFGDGCILRTSEIDTPGRNWTIYFRNSHQGVSVGRSSCRALGDQIRCVRDINLKE